MATPPSPFHLVAGVASALLSQEPALSPFALISAATHTAAVAVGLAIGLRTRFLPLRSRYSGCCVAALAVFAALTLLLAAAFNARLPIVHSHARCFFDAEVIPPSSEAASGVARGIE